MLLPHLSFALVRFEDRLRWKLNRQVAQDPQVSTKRTKIVLRECATQLNAHRDRGGHMYESCPVRYWKSFKRCLRMYSDRAEDQGRRNVCFRRLSVRGVLQYSLVKSLCFKM